MNERRIAVLPDVIANRIAAGEVIQRPSSVVKELLENSLDAGATRLAVAVKEGGKKHVQVTDDGSGMDEQDAVACFLRHATSKIATYEDLLALRTFGFRGEALASIAAVARVTLKTRRADQEAAVVVRIDGGGEPSVSHEGREKGTSISVQNLFFNVPARRKFLKSVATEFHHVYDEVQRVAISREDITLQFVSDDDTIFHLRPSSRDDRLLDIFGKRQCDAMLPLEEENELVKVTGYIGKPGFGHKTRQYQYVYLNGRFITNRTINHAVYSAYEHLLDKGSFPFFLLFLQIDPGRVDVNVHPSKLEAKFDDEQGLYRFISSSARRCLSAAGAAPALSLGTRDGDPGAIGLRYTPRQYSWPGDDSPSVRRLPGGVRIDAVTGEILPQAEHVSGEEYAARLLGIPPQSGLLTENREQNDTTIGRSEIPDFGETSIVWQLHNKYILAPVPNGLLIVDQHVAHERVLYERAVRRFAASMRNTQQVLFPHTLDLAADDFALLSELLPDFTLLGFDVKPFGKNTVIVEGLPPDVRIGMEDTIVKEILELYKENRGHGPMDVRENLAKSFACKSAVKAGDPLSPEEMRSLISQLAQATMPYVCPHGRPIVLRISVKELDHRFGRTG
jgi:DNA mismatch repair protein MutL